MRSFLLGTIFLLLLVACDFGNSNPTPNSTSYAISGSVSGSTAAGVTIAINGAAAASTSTDADGNYTFSGLSNGDYSVTANKNGYTFSPPSIPVTVNRANVAGKNFTAMVNQLQLLVFAGAPTGAGNVDGTGADARFNGPSGVAVDGSGNVYVADTSNHTIRKVTSAGVVSTFAGTAGQSGSADGTGADARFNYPNGVAVDGSGNIYVADSGNNTIRKITPAGVVSTLAGSASEYGSTDGAGVDARFYSPSGVAVDGSGNVYVADSDNNTIRKIIPGGTVSTLAGLVGQTGSTDGTGAAARFSSPSGVAVDGSGNVFVADTLNNTIRKVTPSGVVSTFAGLAGQRGIADGTGTAALFNRPVGIAVDGSGNLFVADTMSCTIRKVTPSRVVSTFAGSVGQAGSANGTGTAAGFYSPLSVAVDGSGNVYVADTQNHTLRTITPAGVVSTRAGTAGQAGSADGVDASSRFYYPRGVAVDGSGTVYVADTWNNTIRKITPKGVVSTLAGKVREEGSTDGTGANARFLFPQGVAADGSGNVYVADTLNHTIRKVTPAGEVSTFAGLAGQSGSADGAGSTARFSSPFGVAVDGSGNIYVADAGNGTIRKVTPTGLVSTLAGTAGQYGSIDDTGAAARFEGLNSVTVDGSGNVYVAESVNRTIRKVTPEGVVSTLAGTAEQYGYVDGAGVTAQFKEPNSISVDGFGNVYVADTWNHAIRKVTPEGVVSTVVGVPGRNGIILGPLPAVLYAPWGVAFDSTTGSLFIVVDHAVLEATF